MHSRTRLDSDTKESLAFILPVDPMAWSGSPTSAIGPGGGPGPGGGRRGQTTTAVAHDVLLSVSKDGELTFWVPEEGTGGGWRVTGRVRTGRRGIRMVRCSSAKKSVLGTCISCLYTCPSRAVEVLFTDPFLWGWM